MYVRNEEFFSIPNETNSYWAGFIAADGYIKLNSGKILNLHLHRKDKPHLEAFHTISESTVPVKDCHEKCCVSNNSSKKWVEDLENNWNITTKKSLTLPRPYDATLETPEALSFIVGYIDGDGCWDWHKSKYGDYLRLQIEGTEDMVGWILEVMPGGKIYSRARNGGSEVYTLRYVGSKAKAVDDLLVDSAVDVRMGRKWWPRDFKRPPELRVLTDDDLSV